MTLNDGRGSGHQIAGLRFEVDGQCRVLISCVKTQSKITLFFVMCCSARDAVDTYI